MTARRAFSLIELLVVIAIIAILAALLFPVFERVREGTRQSKCMSQMHDLWLAVNLYKEDEGKYPPAIYGFAENPNGSYNTTGVGVVRMDAIVHGFVYRKHYKDAESTKCPDNAPVTMDQVAVAHYPLLPTSWPINPTTGTRHSYITDTLGAVCPSDAFGIIDCFTSGPLTGQPRYYYTWDSYDIGPRIAANGAPVRNGAQFVYDRHYNPDWTGVANPDDLSNQLKYKNPPLDKTLLTYCTWHSAINGATIFTSLTMGGTTKKVEYKDMLQFGANYYNR